MDYIIQVKKNAEVMAKAFIAKGYHVISGGTDNHMVLADLRGRVHVERCEGPDLAWRTASTPAPCGSTRTARSATCRRLEATRGPGWVGKAESTLYANTCRRRAFGSIRLEKRQILSS